jgi:hypothetical protein
MRIRPSIALALVAASGVAHAQDVPDVRPVMLIASDRQDPAAVEQAVANYASVTQAAADWLERDTGRRIRMLAPVTFVTGREAWDWKNMTDISDREDFRYYYFERVIADFTAQANLRPKRHYLISAFIGPEGKKAWMGAAAAERYAVLAPRVNSVYCPDFLGQAMPPAGLCSDAVYSVVHELGHTFGLGHSCEEFPSDELCKNSPMQAAKPPLASLLPKERELYLSGGAFD